MKLKNNPVNPACPACRSGSEDSETKKLNFNQNCGVAQGLKVRVKRRLDPMRSQLGREK